MSDQDCVRFLQETLPQLHLRWPGYRRVRHQVCKRIRRRLGQLDLPDIHAYRHYLESHPGEWKTLDGFCRITISRFYRDQGVFRRLEHAVLPQLIDQVLHRGEPNLRVWCAGCGAGEEPYSLVILWSLSENPAFGRTGLKILATDADPDLLQRAHRACYPRSSLRDLPAGWRKRAFSHRENACCLLPEYRNRVHFQQHDIRSGVPDSSFHLVLCRNLAFTYFDTGLQREIGQRIADTLRPGGALILGAHERLPAELTGFVPWPGNSAVYSRQ